MNNRTVGLHALINVHEYHLCDTYAVLVDRYLLFLSNSVLIVYMCVSLSSHIVQPRDIQSK